MIHKAHGSSATALADEPPVAPGDPLSAPSRSRLGLVVAARFGGRGSCAETRKNKYVHALVSAVTAGISEKKVGSGENNRCPDAEHLGHRNPRLARGEALGWTQGWHWQTSRRWHPAWTRDVGCRKRETGTVAPFHPRCGLRIEVHQVHPT
jgi:hypothetical protein